MFLGVRPFPGPCLTYQNPHLRETWLSFPKKLPTINSSLMRVQGSGTPSCWNIEGLILCLTCAGNHNFHEFMSIMTRSLPKDAISSRSSHASGSHHHSIPFSPMVPEACGGKCDKDIPFVAEHPLVLRALTNCEFLH